MATNEKLDWREIDPSSLQPAVAKAYGEYKNMYAKAKEAREHFERLAEGAVKLPATHRLVISYNFGRLSMAIDVAKSDTKASKKAVPLSALTV